MASSTPYTAFNEKFKAALGQDIIFLEATGESKAAYDVNRGTIWNLDMANKEVASIVQPKSSKDVSLIMKAYNHCNDGTTVMPKLSVACGRHSSQSLVENALVVDLSCWKEITVDPKASTVTAYGGAKLGDMDEALSKHGLCAVTGTNPDTGVIGLSITGGAGYTSRKHGFAVDNFVHVELVGADGTIYSCSETENQDLFWGVRGGGGHFGIVTSLTMRCHPLRVVAVVEHPIVCIRGTAKKTATVLYNFGKFVISAPDEMGGIMILPCKAPVNVIFAVSSDTSVVPQDPLPKGAVEVPMNRGAIRQAIFGKNAVQWADIPGLRDLEHDTLGGSFRLGGSSLKLMDYHNGVQKYLVPHQGSGHYYEASFLLETMTPEVTKILAHHTKTAAPNKQSALLIFSHGGKCAKKSDSETALEGRNFNFWVIIEGQWLPSTNPVVHAHRKKQVQEWTRAIRRDLSKHGLKETSHSFEGENEDSCGAEGGFVSNKERLNTLKQKYDPNNTFSCNKTLKGAPQKD